MRSEQIVGFTAKAENFIKTMKTRTEFISLCSFQMDEVLPFSNEHLQGFIIEVKPSYPSVNRREYYIQKVQMVPWSSGPMYFFHFEHYLEKHEGQVINLGDCFSWVRDPLLTTEFDTKEGTFNL